MSRRKDSNSSTGSPTKIDFDGHNHSKIHYLTLVVISLPSLMAVIIPVVPNTPAGSDVAILLTDTLVILIISWIIKYLIEWPWIWLSQIREAKTKLFNSINSTLLMETRSHQFQTNDHQLTESLVVLKRLIKYEKLASGVCLASIFIGSALMVVTRTYIIVEPSRKSIVFSNLNISIFIIWGMLKFITSVLDSLRGSSLIGIEKPDEYNLINDNNLGQLFSGINSPNQNILPISRWFKSSPIPPPSQIAAKSFSDIIETLKDELLLDALAEQLTQQFQTSQFHFNASVNDFKQEAELLKRQLAQLSNRLELVKNSPKETKIEQNTSSSVTNFKPYPLSVSSNLLSKGTHKDVSDYNRDTSTLKSSVGSTLTTIFEEMEERNKDQRDNQSQLQYVENQPIDSISFESEPATELYQFPLWDQIKSFWNKYSDKFKNPKQGTNLAKDKLSNEIGSLFSILELFIEIFYMVKRIRKSYPIASIYRNPMILKAILQNEVIPLLLKVDDSALKIVSRTETAKQCVWKAVFETSIHNYYEISRLFELTCKKYVKSTKCVISVTVYMFVKTPYNLATSGLRIILFIPRVLIQIFIVYPILAATSETHEKPLEISNEPISIRESTQSLPLSITDSMNFKGMREFHLNKGTEFPTDFKTKKMVVERMAERLKKRNHEPFSY